MFTKKVQITCAFTWLSILAYGGDVHNVRLPELSAPTIVLYMSRSSQWAPCYTAAQTLRWIRFLFYGVSPSEKICQSFYSTLLADLASQLQHQVDGITEDDRRFARTAPSPALLANLITRPMNGSIMLLELTKFALHHGPISRLT